LSDFGEECTHVPLMCDSMRAISVAKNPVLHSRTKHIEVRYHFLRDNVVKGNINLNHVPTQKQLAKLPFLVCRVSLVWIFLFELGLGISCTYASCIYIFVTYHV
jgi:hypothetical protein